MKKLAALALFLFWYSYTSTAQPNETPTIFLEGVVSSNLNERDMAISPDGADMFYTLQANQNAFSTIIHRKKISDNKWSVPEVASFSGKFADLEPAFSHDGQKLFFASNRPISGNQPKDYDIWMTQKVNGKWSEPINVGSVVNTAANEFYPSVAISGNLYFTSEYEKGIGREDIYVCQYRDDKYEASIALDTAVNSKLWEFNAFIAPDESFILFTSYGRKDDHGGGDLYISLKDSNGKWKPAKNLEVLNSNKLDYCPFVSSDKKILYFTSGRHSIPPKNDKAIMYADLVKTYSSAVNGSENIYWVKFEGLLRSLE